jgi:hypothetical protein
VLYGAVMKKTVCALALILMVFFFMGLSSNGPILVRVAEANPYNPVACTVFSPQNNTVYGNSTVEFSFKIDPIVKCKYYYSLDDQIKLKYVYLENTSLTDSYGEPLPPVLYRSIELADLSDGQHNLTIQHLYKYWFVENQWCAPLDASVIFYVDTTAPKITNFSVNGTETTDRLLNFAVDEEASWIGYSLDDQANVTINGNTTLKGLSAGSHNVTVYAEDVAGDMGASETLLFTIEEPFPTLLVATASIVVVAVFAVFLFYMRKHKH